MGGRLNLDGGTRNLDGGTLTFDEGMRPPMSPPRVPPYNLSTAYTYNIFSSAGLRSRLTGFLIGALNLFHCNKTLLDSL